VLNAGNPRIGRRKFLETTLAQAREIPEITRGWQIA